MKKKNKKVLFIVSGNSPYFKITPFIKTQGDSLEKLGYKVEYFRVQGKGIRGYFKNIRPLARFIKAGGFDIIHAHYSFNALLCLLTFSRKTLVLSLMGSDAYGAYNPDGGKRKASFINVLISKLVQPFMNAIIYKSPNIGNTVAVRKKAYLIPNGVNLSFYREMLREEACEILGLPPEKKIVLFMANKNNPRKNFHLVNEAMNFLPQDYLLISPYPVDPAKTLYYYNSCDVLVLSSFNEGSPNVIKEAMACNIPIVSTKVGDVEWLFGGIDGHFLAPFDPEGFAKKIIEAADFNEKTKGRERLGQLGLDLENTAKKIIEVYKAVSE